MNYWLLKTEPSEYAYKDLERDGRCVWEGVTNNWALTFLRQVAKGDRVLIYHTGDDKCVAGLAEVIRSAYPDPKLKDDKLVVLDLKPVNPLPRPVTLAQMKKDKRFADFELVKFSRLSVMPVSSERFKLLVEMGGAS